MGLFDFALNTVGGILGLGPEQRDATHTGTPYQGAPLDASKFQYGGYNQNDYQKSANDADNRAAPQANYAMADQDRGNAWAARGSQSDALDMYRQGALGLGPSAAQSQLQSGIDQSIRAQQAMANSARGGAGALAAAQMGAAQQAGQMTAGATAQAAALRAQEQQAALQGYAGLGSTMRGQDYTSQGLAAQQAQFQAQMQAQGRAQNDQRALAEQQLGQNAANTAYGGAMDEAKTRAGILTGADQSNKAEAAAAKDRALKYVGIGAQTASSIAGAAMGSDERLKERVSDGASAVREALDALNAKVYSYHDAGAKSLGEDTRPRIGIMAQDLAKSGLGASTIRRRTTDGALGVDYNRGLSLALAGVADLHKRLKAKEK